MGPAPAVAAVRSAVRAVLSAHRRVLVACSGGADSLALAAAVAFEAPRAGCAAGLVTVDHGLQPGSAAVAARVAAVGYELGFDPVEVLPVAVDFGGGGGPEAAARNARYAALDGAALALDAVVLLGHTLDDQAETVLLGLGRGSGPRSIAGMRPLDGRYARPLLGLRRSLTAAACAALGLEPWADPHNVSPEFQRVRLRTEVLPLLEDALQGGVAEALARTADLLQDDLDALEAWAAAALPTVLAARPGDTAPPGAAAVPGPDPAGPPSTSQPALTVINSGESARSGAETRVDHPGEGGREALDGPALDGEALDGPALDGPEMDGAGALDVTALDVAALDVAALAALPRAVRTRVLRAWAGDGGAAPLSAERTAALDGLITAWRGQGPIQLSGGVSVRRVSGRLERSGEQTREGP